MVIGGILSATLLTLLLLPVIYAVFGAKNPTEGKSWIVANDASIGS